MSRYTGTDSMYPHDPADQPVPGIDLQLGIAMHIMGQVAATPPGTRGWTSPREMALWSIQCARDLLAAANEAWPDSI